jgi:hypothetical protein
MGLTLVKQARYLKDMLAFSALRRPKSRAAIVFAFISITQATSQAAKIPSCLSDAELFADLSPNNVAAKGFAKRIKKSGLDQHAYAVDWSLPKNSTRGPWLGEGQLVVLGVTREQLGAWKNEVASVSMGFTVEGLPGRKLHTAGLRVRNKYYPHDRIAGWHRAEGLEGRPDPAPPIQDVADMLATKTHFKQRGMTEVTFLMSPAELDAIEAFLEARMNHRIVATEDVRVGRRTIAAGAEIRPAFDEQGTSLLDESCAGACMSWLNRDWLEHYQAPKALIEIAAKYHLEPTHVARRALWSNARNPMAGGLTLFNIETSNRALIEDFIANNGWDRIRGQERGWGFIPDNPGSKTYQSSRSPIGEWLKRQK